MRIGKTGDSNNYPILLNEGSRKIIVGVPVDDYQEMTNHLDVIDDKLTQLENIVEVTDYTPVWGDGELKGIKYETKPSISFGNYIRCGRPKRFDWIKEKQ